jgi:hypothetical protein
MTPSGRTFREMRVPIISKIDGFVQQCESFSLAFDWNVLARSNDVIWSDLHGRLVDHFAARGLVFAILGQGAIDNDVLPWTIYMCSQSARVDYMGPLLRATNSISPEEVTHKDLQHWAKRNGTLSGPDSSRKLVFIGMFTLSCRSAFTDNHDKGQDDT